MTADIQKNGHGTSSFYRTNTYYIFLILYFPVKANHRGQTTTTVTTTAAGSTTKVFSPPPATSIPRKKSGAIIVGGNHPFKDGRARRLCRKKSRSWKSWFEGRETGKDFLPLPTESDHVKRRKIRSKHISLMVLKTD